MTSATINPATVLSSEEFRCFVCDIVVSGRYYALATCRTQSTKIRLIEKLGQLVGERYMVVISEDDIICRGCANLMNTLDRLETEMCSVRNVVLRFLEKKYALEEGELLNNKTTVSCPPPQILHNTSIIPGSKSKANAGVENFMSRKRKAALMDMENEQKNNLPSLNSKLQKTDPKSNVWMQCDKCKYTTHYNAFMIHHIRQHVKKKNATCDYCGDEVQSGGSCAKQCNANNSSAQGKQMKNTQKQVKKYLTEDGGAVMRCEGSDTAECETVEMITAEINEFRTPGKGTDSQNVVISTVQTTEGEPGMNGVTDESILSAIHSAGEAATTAIIIDQSQQNSASLGPMKSDVTIQVADIPEQTEGNVEVQLNDVDGSTPTAICVMDMSEDSSAEQPTLLTVQKMEDESSAVYVQVVEVGKTEETEDARNVTKQVLTVSEDGTVEMVEVMWDEMVSADVGTEQDITFG